MAPPCALLVFSHLRWDFVYQRPQHLLSRLARTRRVLFVEEPVHDPHAAEPAWQVSRPAPNVLVCRLATPTPAPGFNDEQLRHFRGRIAALLAAEGVGAYAAWLYTPMALPLLDGLAPRAIVYDCMDELSLFLYAPPELLAREDALFARADLVFTGGPSLYRAKKDRHPAVHCFPSSVDAAHFGRAGGALPEPDDQAGLPHPRLGYFGVIDERLDLDLLDHVARSRPDWQIVMVGPVAKIDPAALPRRANLHFLGGRTYAELPAYLAGWDACLLPFARNDATRFISPTKTLEYMAAAKPIVSTPIADVAGPYGDIVYLGGDAAAFLAACDRALAAPPVERAARAELGRAVLANTSWDRTAAAMDALLTEAAAPRSRRTPPVVIVGAGPTGLSAAHHLGEDALLLEANDRVGGWCRSVVHEGFTFDFAGHIMFSNDPYVHEMYDLLLGDNVHWQDREAWIFSKEVYTRYPFQGALYGLPPAVIKECIVGAIEARYGALKPKPAAAPVNYSLPDDKGGNGTTHANGHASGNGSVGKSATGADDLTPKAGPRNFEEFIYQVWGAGIAKHFAIPYNRKIWAVPLAEMETSWLGGRVPLPDLEEMIEGALHPVGKPMGPNARFGYPLRGGFQALMDGFLPHLRGPVRLETRVAAVSPSRRVLTLDDGTELPYEALVSTMPLPMLVRQMGDEAPPEIQAAAAALRHTSVRCVHLGVGRERLTDKHWIYYPEDTVFHRIFVQGNASPHCNAPGGFGLTCEITYSPHKPLPCDGEALIQRCIDDCCKVGIFTADDPIVAACQVDMPYAYVVYDHDRPRNVKLLRDWLLARDIHLAGRYSEWEYYNSDHAFLAGKRVADQARPRLRIGVPV